ncbi:UNVERIFIED_CONTAM: Polyprotein P3 [Sesamum latifolium]|uniref:Polyprotein P3 n=1 Tax=Sesamum latifolium TaxID=2727402 RepID=A0AAW2VXM9_9LAMI
MMSFLDAFQGYNQISLEPQDQEKTSFITEQGTFCYQVMPFGLKNAGATYQRLVNKVFNHMIGRNMEVYIDDMLVKSHSKKSHVKDLRECFEVVRRLGMKLNPSKCTFRVQGGKFLGYLISYRGIEVNHEKIKAIQEMSHPRTKKEIQKLTGRMAALSRFLSRGAERGLPFFKTLRKVDGFSWNEECQKAFESLKQYLSKPPVLTKPQMGEKLYVYLSASEEAVSAVLVTVLTNQPLKHILASPNASGRMTKWAIELSEHGIEFEARPAIKAQVLADFISEVTGNEDSIHRQEWTMFVDGSSTSSKSGVSIVIKSPEADYIEYAITLEFPASNNEAEYEAILLGCKLIHAAGARKVHAYSDSQLIVSQAEREYEARQETMTKYLAKLREETAKFEELRLEQIPREQNMMADQLAKLASSNQFNGGRRITLLSAAKPMVGLEEGEEKEIEGVLVGDSLPSTWMTPIIRFLTEGLLPKDSKEAGKIKLRSARFVMIDRSLYKRGFSSPLLKCLNNDKAEYVLREVHEGSCGNHSGARSLARKVLRLGYYWPTMVKDALSLVQKCSPCQRHANYQHNPAAYMKTLESPCPFDMWGMDIVEKLPHATGQREYLIVAVDYFTKWVEAEPLAKIGEKK